MVSDLLVNISLLTSFTFMWHQLFRKKRLTLHSPYKVKIQDGIIGGLLGVLLLHYSIQVNEITILDLRHIPVILLAYYGGYLPALLAAIIISIGRFMIDINFSSVVSLFMMLTMAIGSSFIVYCIKTRAWKKWLMLLLFSQFVYTLALYIVVDQFHEVLDFAFYHIISSFIGGLITFYFVSYIRGYSELYLKYKEGSETDSLTGLYNVRAFDYYYNTMLENAKSDRSSCAICLVDIDHFKKINDTYGHLAGDQVLKQLAKLIKKQMREGDIVSRNGGDEFSILLKNCNLMQAEEIAVRIRKAVEENWFVLANKKRIKITVSIGIAAYQEGKSAATEELYQKADDALYKAKHEGRNSVRTKTDCS